MSSKLYVVQRAVTQCSATADSLEIMEVLARRATLHTFTLFMYIYICIYVQILLLQTAASVWLVYKLSG